MLTRFPYQCPAVLPANAALRLRLHSGLPKAKLVTARWAETALHRNMSCSAWGCGVLLKLPCPLLEHTFRQRASDSLFRYDISVLQPVHSRTRPSFFTQLKSMKKTWTIPKKFVPFWELFLFLEV